ncbi:helix-turn-helix domain-containing protein [Clostridium tyrobutyricum]|uniref:helix-turn-helix domain-containing protein n=1 Tax=Clostridium tyrobutyricum TaxID=1519 RepID=UPI00073DA8EC|nr:helix-turn-helix transcriptional regulator [Clostridium tyrobutyricum]
MTRKEMNDKDQELLRSRLKARRLFLNYTYQDLADKTGISKSSLQRYETGAIKNLSYDKIFKLSEALEVTPKYFTDLENDYTGEYLYNNNSVVMESRTSYLSHIDEFTEKALKLITPSLISQGYTVEQRDRGSIGDLVATKGNETWHIDFLYNRDVSKYPVGMGMGKQQLLLRFGRLVVYDKSVTKYSIVVKHRSIAEQLLKIKPIHLNIPTSIILLKNDNYEELFFMPEK